MANQGTDTNFSGSGNSYGPGPDMPGTYTAAAGSSHNYGPGPSTNTAAGGSNNYGPGPSTYAPTSGRSVAAKVAPNGYTMSESIQDLSNDPRYAPRPGANASTLTSGGSTEPRVAPNGYMMSSRIQDLTDDPKYASTKTAQEDKSRSSTHAGSSRHSHRDTRKKSGSGSLLGQVFRTERSKTDKERKGKKGQKEKIILIDD